MKLTISLILKFIKNQVIWEGEKGKNVKERKKESNCNLKKKLKAIYLYMREKHFFKRN